MVLIMAEKGGRMVVGIMLITIVMSIILSTSVATNAFDGDKPMLQHQFLLWSLVLGVETAGECILEGSICNPRAPNTYHFPYPSLTFHYIFNPHTKHSLNISP